MTLPPLDSRRGRDLVARLSGRQVLVVGDILVDRFIVDHAAGVVVSKFGPATLTAEELLAALT
jgi:bifunctional ADP-heptose synthase (sugar kinase/adenylyltransferase)